MKKFNFFFPCGDDFTLPHGLYLINSPTGMGLTTLGLNIASEYAGNRKKVLYLKNDFENIDVEKIIGKIADYELTEKVYLLKYDEDVVNSEVDKMKEVNEKIKAPKLYVNAILDFLYVKDVKDVVKDVQMLNNNIFIDIKRTDDDEVKKGRINSLSDFDLVIADLKHYDLIMLKRLSVRYKVPVICLNTVEIKDYEYIMMDKYLKYRIIDDREQMYADVIFNFVPDTIVYENEAQSLMACDKISIDQKENMLYALEKYGYIVNAKIKFMKLDCIKNRLDIRGGDANNNSISLYHDVENTYITTDYDFEKVYQDERKTPRFSYGDISDKSQ